MSNHAFDPAELRLSVKHALVRVDALGREYQGDGIDHACTKIAADTRQALRAFWSGRIDAAAVTDYYMRGAAALAPIVVAATPWVMRAGAWHYCLRYHGERHGTILDVDLDVEIPVFTGCTIECSAALLAPRSVAAVLTSDHVEGDDRPDADAEIALVVSYPAGADDRAAWEARLDSLLQRVDAERSAS